MPSGQTRSKERRKGRDWTKRKAELQAAKEGRKVDWVKKTLFGREEERQDFTVEGEEEVQRRGEGEGVEDTPRNNKRKKESVGQTPDSQKKESKVLKEMPGMNLGLALPRAANNRGEEMMEGHENHK